MGGRYCIHYSGAAGGDRRAPAARRADCYLSSEASLISEAASKVGAPASEISRRLGHLGTSEAPGQLESECESESESESEPECECECECEFESEFEFVFEFEFEFESESEA